MTRHPLAGLPIDPEAEARIEALLAERRRLLAVREFLRHGHEPEPNTAPRFVARVVALAAKLPNDAELGAAIRALIGGER